MVYLFELQREQEERAKRMLESYKRVTQKRKNETPDQIWRREQAGLKWLDDYLLESDAFLRNCIFDGKNLKIPGREGYYACINAGYKFGFDIPLEARPGGIPFSIYVMHLHEKQKQIYQCPECKIVYSLPMAINVNELRKSKKPRPLLIGARI